MGEMNKLSIFANDLLDTNGHQSRCRTKPYMRSEFRQQMRIRPRNPAVSDITDDSYLQIIQSAFSLTDGASIEQRLCRMFVCAITAIDDARLCQPAQCMRCS